MAVTFLTNVDQEELETKIDNVAESVENYTETDPTVPAWAKAANKPTYTASEVGALSEDSLPTAINTALAQAKASGEFNGKDGVSATHSWNGTTLTITSASGTSSANLKGEKGDKGDPGEKGDKGDTGATGANGKDGTSVTVKSVSESTADGGSNVVTFSDGTTLNVKNGSKGNKGDPGTTPQKGIDFWTDADQESIVQDVIRALGTPVFGRVDEQNNIVLTGNLVEGNSYTVKYEDAEGNVMDVGSIVFEAPPAYTNLLESAGYVKDKRLSSTDGTTLKDATGFYLTGYIPVPLNGVVRFQGINVGGSSYGNTVYIYDSSKKFLGAPTSTGLNETARNCEAVYDSSNYLKQFTAKSTIMKSSPAFAGGYMRFGAVSISDGAIITVNEEIV